MSSVRTGSHRASALSVHATHSLARVQDQAYATQPPPQQQQQQAAPPPQHNVAIGYPAGYGGRCESNSARKKRCDAERGARNQRTGICMLAALAVVILLAVLALNITTVVQDQDESRTVSDSDLAVVVEQLAWVKSTQHELHNLLHAIKSDPSNANIERQLEQLESTLVDHGNGIADIDDNVSKLKQLAENAHGGYTAAATTTTTTATAAATTTTDPPHYGDDDNGGHGHNHRRSVAGVAEHAALRARSAQPVAAAAAAKRVHNAELAYAMKIATAKRLAESSQPAATAVESPQARLRSVPAEARAVRQHPAHLAEVATAAATVSGA